MIPPWVAMHFGSSREPTKKRTIREQIHLGGAANGLRLDDEASCCSAKLPVFPRESRRSLEARIQQAHQLVAGSTSEPKQRSKFTIVYPSFPLSPMALLKRTYSAVSGKSDRTVATVSTSASGSIASHSTCNDDYQPPSLLRSCSEESVISALDDDLVADDDDDNDWGYFVDVADEKEERPKKEISTGYRPFMRHTMHRGNQ
ncbi:expressed unknown protein [Seminavis robusta]|uniref:Uncharacterized protein n=1 Tax=Seminavis robusta TaxID=568900 RepID=A0A9N8ELT9_9STRA|nr:expressed unknown protein [Seminavis robusta]|eukprot:Sro1433_g272260.1 n/a (202) ;mRNA; f:23285-23890